MESFAGRRFGPGRLKSRPVWVAMGASEYEHCTTVHNAWGREVKEWCDWVCHIRLSSQYTLHNFSLILI